MSFELPEKARSLSTQEPASAHSASSARHGVQFYQDVSSLSDAVCEFLGAGLAAGDSAVAIATPAHRDAFVARLIERGFDPKAAEARGRLVFLDAHDTLQRFMIGSAPDPMLFRSAIEPLLVQLAASSQTGAVRAYGEMVDILWQQGNRAATMLLESLWNDLQKTHRFKLFCGYLARGFHAEVNALKEICSAHTHAFGLEAISSSTATSDRVQRLFAITSALAEAVTDAQVFEALVDRVAQVLDASSAALWVVDEASHSAKLVRTLGYAPTIAKAFDAVSLERGGSFPAVDCMRQGEPIWIASQTELLARYPHLGSAVTPNRTYRIACLPLLVGDQTVGALGLTLEHGEHGDEDDRTFLLLVAGYASQALARLRLVEHERRGRELIAAEAARTAAMSRASRAFVEASLDLQRLLQSVVDEVTTDYADGAGITLVAQDGESLDVVAIDPRSERAFGSALASARIRVGEGLTGRVVSTGQPFLINDFDPSAFRATAHPLLQAIDAADVPRRVLLVPLRTRGKILGTLGALRYQSTPEFSERDLVLLQELAERAATAIDNTRLHQENEAARLRAEELYRFADAVVRAERLEQLFEAALDAISRALGTDRLAILTFDEAGAMRFRAWRNLSPEYRAAVEGHSPWPATATAPQPVIVADASSDPSMQTYRPLFEREGIGALSFIPLVSSNRLLGKFMVYYRDPHAFRPLELELAIAIANHLAAAVIRFAAVEKLQDTLRYHELFTGVLAHDLRNPLSAISTAAMFMDARLQGADDAFAKPVHRIAASSARMARMISQLLDFTRARIGGGIEVHRGPTSLARVCDGAIAEIETAHPEWRFRREVLGDPSGAWDADRLLQAVSNLTANAGQHGVRGTEVIVRIDGTHDDSVRLAIRNQGSIPEALRGGLFDPFRRASAPHAHSSGLGLGLFITKEIVEAHGGTVEVESSQRDGTSFIVTLPRGRA